MLGCVGERHTIRDVKSVIIMRRLQNEGKGVVLVWSSASTALACSSSWDVIGVVAYIFTAMMPVHRALRTLFRRVHNGPLATHVQRAIFSKVHNVDFISVVVGL